jgi:signal transduction histidine kinase
MLYDDEQRPLVTAAIRQTLETGGYSGELERVRADGSRFPARIHASVLNDENGRPIGVIGAARDITAVKAAERIELERASLENAVQSMNQVLGVLGHELRTPLAALRASSELLQTELKPCLDADAAMMVNMIHDETVRMAQMVDDILEAARLNSGRAKWQWSSINVQKNCHDAVSTVMPLVDSARVTLECLVDPPHLVMQGDADAFRRLLINLLTNAIKHTDQGSIAVTIREAVAHGRRQVAITCQDTGEGIDPKVCGKLGEPFALNAGLIGGQNVTGSGLGLAICKGIVAAHGGTITVRSKRHRGTTFSVTLEADLDQPQAFTEPIDITQEAA